MANKRPRMDPVQTAPGPLSGTSVDSVASAPPRPTRHASSPSFDSLRRHQHRQPTAPRRVKETLNARSEYTSQDDGAAQHRINQYIIKQEIGRGSFGAVHLAVDQYGNEYAVKEFSKARLKKRQQSHMVRRPRGPQRPGSGFNSPLHRHPSGSDDLQTGHPLDLIKEEIAIMKKLNHNNLVSLIEVLDDPTEDSLYMVMEMCKKGVIMKVGLEERADPYDDESCRMWFRDLILAIEYLHAQGIVHRDIKPDNCLLTSDDVLKVVDFGVSEMFAKNSEMYTAKSAGSPAFLPPELCIAKHGDVSGKAADIWSMGVTLYCLRYGHIPFEKQSIFELYESIRNDEPDLEGETDEDFIDLMHRILEKDPAKRITMPELRNHPWVTRRGADPLLPEEENTAQMIEPPTEEEMNSAITNNLGNLLVVMKAVQRFKRLVDPAKSPALHSILGREHESHFVQPPLEMEPDERLDALNSYKRVQREGDIPQTTSRERGRSPKRAGSARISSPHGSGSRGATPALQSSRDDTPSTKRSISEGTRGHARDPLEEECPYLFIGPSTFTGELTGDPDISVDGIPDTLPPVDPNAVPVVSESPGASEIDIYETAYREEIERIKRRTMARRDTVTKVYLTRRVEGKKNHLSEVLKLIQQAQEESESHATSEPILQIGDKISGAVASAGPAVSALTAQLEVQRQKEQPGAESGASLTATQDKQAIPPSPATADQNAVSVEPNNHPSSARKLASVSDVVTEMVNTTAEKSQGLKALVERVKSGEGSHETGAEAGTTENAQSEMST
ncbi:hypothetical protein VTN77DRAFT_869 [Rasamsonia byssochlamydoides]|uniref:uncharacterized protein n=1 Tax=Rasamsonia byssochlamydoides TaxID=89139 RepID=UPI00374398C8